ncbi:MAG: hypothetical protein PHU25_01880 [Deltaproteobacteria bacterium]|nr:hypothetical protein [Deltaproteobacteria bacterium]
MAHLPDLPLSQPAADLVIITALAAMETSYRPEIDPLLKAARSAIQPSGLLAILVPNRDAQLLEGSAPAGLPGFLDLERALRRHFPHVTLLGQQPLHGAVLFPVGRREVAESPILDDRMTSEQVEPPSHFLCLCSSRYRKVDDNVIAELPYSLLADPVRRRLGELSGVLAVVEKESEARARNVEAQQTRIAALTSKLEDVSDLRLEIATLGDKATGLERELARRDKLIADADAARNDFAERLSQMDTRLLEAGRDARKAAQVLADVSHQRDLSAREREDLERERDRLAAEARTLRAENKARQRDQDEAVEQAAAAQAELSALHSEASRQRRELTGARERVRRLEIELAEANERAADLARLEAERNDLQSRTASEHERLESTLREERQRFVGEMAAREKAERNLTAADARLVQVELGKRDLEAARAQAEQRLFENETRRTTLEQDLSRAQARAAELERQLEQRADENKRQELAIDTITRRALAAEKRAAEIEVVLDQARVDLVAARLELERLRPNATSAEAARTRALTAEARAVDLEVELARAKDQVGSASARTEQLEADLERAMAALADGERAIEEAHKESGTTDDNGSPISERGRRVLEIEREVARLKEENETGLLKVREDLETELKYASSQLEARHGEIWELREEIVRLRAEIAASTSAAEHEGSNSDLQHVLAEQESLIAGLAEDREKLRATAEQLRKSLEVRKKNMKILAAVLKRERSMRTTRDATGPDEAPGEGPQGPLVARESDIREILVEAGADMTGDPLEDIDSSPLEDEEPRQLPDNDSEAPDLE